MRRSLSGARQPTALRTERAAERTGIPGVNDFLPLSVAPEILFGLLVGLVVHEGGHGVLSRVEGIDVESMGVVLLTILPWGRSSNPPRRAAPRRPRRQVADVRRRRDEQLRLALVAFPSLFGPVAGAIAVADGVPVGSPIDGTPAADAGIESGDVITAVNGQSVENQQALDSVPPKATHDCRVARKDADTVTVERPSSSRGPSERVTRKLGKSLVSVTGCSRYPHDRQAAQDHPVATLETESGETVTTPLGAYVLVAEDGPLAGERAPSGESMIIAAVNGDEHTAGRH